MKRFWRDNGLSTVLLAFFVVFWAAQFLTGWHVHNGELKDAGQHTLSALDYLLSSHFWAATAENWESEFLQMAAYVVLTIHLRQRGSAESNPYTDDPDADPPETGGSFWRRNGLSLTLTTLFVSAMALHLVGSWRSHNAERLSHGEATQSLATFIGQPDFWFESFQNWQSEFLAVVTLVVLTIKLRQVGSSQSKQLSDPDSKTGS
ncbi:hypothetical protein LAJ19_17965 (plasmid) [Deinococcus taeanensis]|uniref:DUF6766 family protein n=1 Tax=Deinococcus taeanensis TaxID=2737050 RepID=UPI001CDD50CC|nr:DUF6766 family protein [Deinococcus taeanensis]UBV45014.1 hypothetical protein LAJ19_17965 [Deinococcus taeanensis]